MGLLNMNAFANVVTPACNKKFSCALISAVILLSPHSIKKGRLLNIYPILKKSEGRLEYCNDK